MLFLHKIISSCRFVPLISHIVNNDGLLLIESCFDLIYHLVLACHRGCYCTNVRWFLVTNRNTPARMTQVKLYCLNMNYCSSENLFGLQVIIRFFHSWQVCFLYFSTNNFKTWCKSFLSFNLSILLIEFSRLLVVKYEWS